MEERYIASIDLGSSKFGLCVARVTGNDVQVLYYKETPSDGIRASIIGNPKKASLPLIKAVKEAEDELMIRIMQVVVGMPRTKVMQVTANARIERTAPDEYITDEEVQNLKSIALETYPLPNPDKDIMYGAVAQSFSIDDQIQLVESDVVGTLSSTLEGNFKVFIGSRTATTALDKIFNSMNIAIAKKYFLPDVVAKTVLNTDEMQNGVALVDVGAGVTSVAIYHGGIMRYYAAIPFGGKAITNDIRTECSISEDLAEKIKRRFGACQPGKLASLSEKVLQIRLTEPYKEVPVRYISEIIDCRTREIVNAILYYIQESGLQNAIRCGIVLTGGGASLANLSALVKEMSGYDVRLGCPKYQFSASVESGVHRNPGAAAAIGMVLAARDDRLPDCVNVPEPVFVPEEEQVEVEVEIEDETLTEEPVFQEITDEQLQHGETGTILAPEAFGEAVEKPKKPKKEKKVKKVKLPKTGEEKPNILSIVWTKVQDAAIKVYDIANE